MLLVYLFTLMVIGLIFGFAVHGSFLLPFVLGFGGHNRAAEA